MNGGEPAYQNATQSHNNRTDGDEKWFLSVTLYISGSAQCGGMAEEGVWMTGQQAHSINQQRKRNLAWRMTAILSRW